METPADKHEFSELKHSLQAFQSARINTTYADLKSDPQYARIGVFFFEKLYAPDDFSFRDASMRKLQRILEGKVYRGMVTAMTQVVELHETTERIDDRMVAQMMALGVDTDMDMAQYRQVYRSLDNYDERIYQINLSIDVTRAFYRLSRKWLVAISLKTVHATARFLGIRKILDFIYEGYEGFRAISDIEYFVETVQTRELAWHEDIWSGA